MGVRETMNMACEKLRGGQFLEAEKLFRDVLAEMPALPDALHLLGCTLSKLNRPQEATDLIRRATVLDPKQFIFFSNLGLTWLMLANKREAIAAFNQSLALQPNQPGTLLTLSNTLTEVGELDQAMVRLTQAIQLQPNDSRFFYNLGNCFLRKVANHVGPLNPPAEHDLQKAVECFQRALAITPRYLDAGNNLGNALRMLGRMDEAIASWRRTTNTGQHALASYNLGRALYERDLLDDAQYAMQDAIRLSPQYPEAYNNYGNLLRQSGKIEQAIEQFDQALRIDPDRPLANSNRLYTLYYHPRLSAREILREHQLWNQRIAPLLASRRIPLDRDRDPDRRLKIGYVSPNFSIHCQCLFMPALLSNHDHKQFEIFCYSDVKAPDAVTERLRGYADAWRNIAGTTDDQAAEMIRADRIDILVDLTLHMAENRILLFARKPAPVQVTWLGYPGTTGLETMDYRLTDPYLDPPGQFDDDYTEKSVRLPATFWCLDRAALESADVPPVNDLPATTAGHITFGCFNNFCKFNQPLLDLWKRALDAVPGSRMILLAPHGSCQSWVRQTLGDRVSFVARENRPQYLKYYHRIDIGLDTLPYNGHTTTLDSLWMGVPVVTMIGQTVVGRAGLSQLSNLNLTDLITKSPQEFVDCAAHLAGDIPRLTDLRRTLRDRMRASPLLDGRRFARDVEEAYHSIWKTWCTA